MLELLNNSDGYTAILSPYEGCVERMLSTGTLYASILLAFAAILGSCVLVQLDKYQTGEPAWQLGSYAPLICLQTSTAQVHWQSARLHTDGSCAVAFESTFGSSLTKTLL